MSRRDKEGRDRWPREAGSDEGQGALTHCNANGNCSPTLIRLSPVGTFPQGKARVRPVSIAPKGSPCGKGPIPPIRGKCPEGTKRVGTLAPKASEGIERWSPDAVGMFHCLLRNPSVSFVDSSLYTKEPLVRCIILLFMKPRSVCKATIRKFPKIQDSVN